jgi:hypothetical protein
MNDAAESFSPSVLKDVPIDPEPQNPPSPTNGKISVADRFLGFNYFPARIL